MYKCISEWFIYRYEKHRRWHTYKILFIYQNPSLSLYSAKNTQKQYEVNRKEGFYVWGFEFVLFFRFVYHHRFGNLFFFSETRFLAFFLLVICDANKKYFANLTSKCVQFAWEVVNANNSNNKQMAIFCFRLFFSTWNRIVILISNMQREMRLMRVTKQQVTHSRTYIRIKSFHRHTIGNNAYIKCCYVLIDFFPTSLFVGARISMLFFRFANP